MREQILIIEKQTEWRERFAKMLADQGFSVETLGNYDSLLLERITLYKPPDLIILSCNHIGQAEFGLLGHILEQNFHVIVLSSAIPWSDMRRLFLAGADDVTDKPHTRRHLVNVVEEALQSITTLDSYQSVKQRGIG